MTLAIQTKTRTWDEQRKTNQRLARAIDAIDLSRETFQLLTLTEHADVALDLPADIADNEILAFDHANERWQNQTAAEAGLSVVGHKHDADYSALLHAASHEVGGADLVDHDSLTGFVADEHIAHSGVSIIAGTLLTGGGTIAADRTLNVDEGSIDHGSIAGLIDDDHTIYLKADGTRNLSATLRVDTDKKIEFRTSSFWISSSSTLELELHAATQMTFSIGPSPISTDEMLITASGVDIMNWCRAQGFRADGDPGGLANTVTSTNVVATPTGGVGPLAGGTGGKNEPASGQVYKWRKEYDGTSVVYTPMFQ